MTTISAKAILVSRNIADRDPKRKLCTLLLRYPRCIHAEFMTHRAFSRNAASSRAIPVKKMIDAVLDDPFVPLFWGSNKPGMQAGDECNERVILEEADYYHSGSDTEMGWFEPVSREEAWQWAMHRSISVARAFAKAGYHKQIVNRLLEPFSHITVVVTATEWDNFFALRDHPAAEPHIRLLAQRIREAIDTAPVQELTPGAWHTPFTEPSTISVSSYGQADLIKLSVARCASTSYKTVDEFDMTLERATDLHDKLVSNVPMHASPLEHQAQADYYHPYLGRDFPQPMGWSQVEKHRNFVGWRQYRAMHDRS